MENELLLFKKIHTDTLTEQTKTKPQEIFDFQMNKQLESYSFSPSTNLFEESKWLLAVTSFEATNSVFNISNENKSFSITTQSHWSSRGCAETNYKLKKIIRAQISKAYRITCKRS